ncbi:MAG: lactate racemase domain-containing protein [Planctomycetota bacterium]
MNRSADIPRLERPALAAGRIDLRARLGDILAALDGDGPLDIAVNDPQRHTATEAVLDVLKAVAPPRPWRLLVACGTHRFAPDRRAAFERRFARFADRIETVRWHRCDADDLVAIGADRRRRVHPRIAADRGPLLAVGSVEPHYFAGLTGAHKTVTIGVADRATIEANHASALSPRARPFALLDNPVHLGICDLLAAVEARRPVTAVDLLQVGRAVHAVAAGRPLSALEALRGTAERVFSHRLDAPADALVLEVDGPLGESFYQADKALKNSEDAVRDGGLLVLVARCDDGVGEDHFVELMRAGPTCADALAVLAARGYRLGDHKAVRLRRLTDPAERGVRIAVVSDGLDEATCRVLGMTPAASVADALAAAGVRPGRDRVYTVEDAGNAVVRHEA